MGKLVDYLEDIYQRLIYLVLAGILIIPLLNPLGLPIKISPMTKKFYNTIDTLQPGDNIAYAFDALSMTWMEQGLSVTAVTKHLMMKEGIKILIFTVSEEGTMFWEKVIDDVGTYGKVYGEDYVFLGYLPGMETAVAAIANDVWDAAGYHDAYGKPLESLPIMERFHSAKNFKIMVNYCRGGPEYYVRQWYTQYGIPLYVLPLSAVEATLMPFIDAGQIEAIIMGSRGAAEYEILMGKPGRAAAGMDAQSFAHLYLLLLIIVGNVAFVLKGMKKEMK